MLRGVLQAPTQTLHHFSTFSMVRSEPSATFCCCIPSPTLHHPPDKAPKIIFGVLSGGWGGEGAPRGKTAKTEGGFAPEYQKRQKVMEGSLRRPHKPPLSRNPGPDAWACCQEKIKGPAMRATTLVPQFLAPPTSSTVLRLRAIPVGGHWHDL